MRPRAIVDVLTLPLAQRLSLLAEGLELIAEQVEALASSVTELQSTAATRGVEPLEGLAAEEASKALILFDLMRMDTRNQRAARDHLAKFNHHLARGIYAQAAGMSPGTLGELRKYVNLLRRQYYLDGPSDVDWVFRNEIVQEREEAQYVDYVAYEDDRRWVSPRDRMHTSGWRTATAPALVGALSRLGACTERGLEFIRDTWNGVHVHDGTSWPEHSALLRRAIEQLIDEALPSETATNDDVALVLERWTFPMSGLDLSEAKVTRSDLGAERADWNLRMAGEWM